jgi:hypothetical protein
MTAARSGFDAAYVEGDNVVLRGTSALVTA